MADEPKVPDIVKRFLAVNDTLGMAGPAIPESLRKSDLARISFDLSFAIRERRVVCLAREEAEAWNNLRMEAEHAAKTIESFCAEEEKRDPDDEEPEHSDARAELYVAMTRGVPYYLRKRLGQLAALRTPPAGEG